MNSILVSLCVLLALQQVCGQGIGDRLLRTAILYKDIPVSATDAQNTGWTQYTQCDPNLGIAYTYSSSGAPSHFNPITVYYTQGGQIGGVALEHFGTPADGLEKFWQIQPNNTYRMSVSFRQPSDMCSGETFPEIIGTQLVLDQGTVDLSLPLTENDATNAQWTKGSCIGGMGTHWSYDLSAAPEMTWVASNLLPIVTMYNEVNGGVLSAFFFTSPRVQLSEPLGPWEGPIPSGLMCLNWCNNTCSFDSSFFSTLHFYLDDPSLNTCDNGRCPSNQFLIN